VRNTLLSTLVVALLLGASSPLVAQSELSKDAKPLVAVSFSGYDQFFADLELIGKLSDNPDLAKGLEAMLKLFTRSRGLEGLDKARPWGAVLQTDGQNHGAHGFIPVTDLKKLLAVLEPFIGKAKDVGDGVFKIKTKKKPLFIQQKGDWAFFADSADLLRYAPVDPLALVGQLKQHYDLAVRFYVSNAPSQVREEFIAKAKENVKRDLQRKPGENDQEYAVRKTVGERMGRTVLAMAKELDEVTIGWALDHEAEKTYLDVTMTAVEGTGLARQFAQMGKTRSNFGGFHLPDAAVTGSWTGRTSVSQEDVAGIATIFDAVRTKAFSDIERQGKPEQETKLGKQLVGDVLDVVQQTLASGSVDGGMAAMLDPDAVTLLAGGYVADPARLDKAAKVLVDVARQQEPASADWVKLDADQFRDVRFHTVSIPIPPDADDRDKVVRLIGEKLEAVVGFGERSIYVAAGRDALKTLKRAIEQSVQQSNRTVPPVRLSVALGPLAKFVAEVGEEKDRPKAAKAAEVLSKMAGKDHVILVASPMDRGVRVRMELEEGILKLIGAMGTKKGSGGTASL